MEREDEDYNSEGSDISSKINWKPSGLEEIVTLEDTGLKKARLSTYDDNLKEFKFELFALNESQLRLIQVPEPDELQ